MNAPVLHSAFENSRLYQLAYDIAWAEHGHEIRRDGSRYFDHALRVSKSVESFKKQYPFIQIVALLHDVPEKKDTVWSIEKLRAVGFHEDILQSLVAITKRPEEKQNYLLYIRRVSFDPMARVVKIADNIDNLNSNPSPEREAFYNISIPYLLAVHRGQIIAGSDTQDFANRLEPEKSIFRSIASLFIPTKYQPA